MDNYSLRQAGKTDFPAIRILIRDVHINPLGLDWRRFLVAVLPDETLIGCGQIKPHADGSRELASIAVDAGYRGRGVARAIISALLEDESRRPLFLMCRSRLEVFYNKFGFQAADDEKLPAYFQRIRRLERLFNMGADPQDRLAIMRLD